MCFQLIYDILISSVIKQRVFCCFLKYLISAAVILDSSCCFIVMVSLVEEALQQGCVLVMPFASGTGKVLGLDS
jgi:hypothetical protein